jgi:PhnB protein
MTTGGKMQSKLNPYISFKDNAREAMEFYKSVFGGTLQMNTFKEFNASENPGDDNKIMHAELETSSGMTIMASDTPARMAYEPGNTIRLSLTGDNESELRRYYDKLVQGGKADMPLNKSQWGDTFGMVTDKYGIEWMVNIAAKKE